MIAHRIPGVCFRHGCQWKMGGVSDRAKYYVADALNRRGTGLPEGNDIEIHLGVSSMNLAFQGPSDHCGISRHASTAHNPSKPPFETPNW